MLVGQREQADEIHRVLGEGVLADGVDAAILDAEVGGATELGAAAPTERREQCVERGQALQLLQLERRADDAGQIADFLGDEEIVLHEALDRAQAGMALIAEPLGHQLLHVEAEPFLGPAGQEMQLATHRPEEALAAAEAPIFVAVEHAGLDELSLGLVGIEMLGEPMQRVQVAQAAFAVLDVGLDQIARRTGAGMADILLGELRLDEGARIAFQHLLAEAMLEIGEQRRVAQDQPRIEQRGADGHVGMAEAHALIDIARGVADLEAEIPEQIEHVFGDALAPGGLLVGKQEQQVDVGARREQPAPIAALRDDGHALRGCRVLDAIDVVGGEIVSELDQRVLESRQAGGAGTPVAILFELASGRGVSVVDQLAHAADQGHAQLRILPGMGAGKLGGLVPQHVEVEIRRWFRCGLVHGEVGRV